MESTSFQTILTRLLQQPEKIPPCCPYIHNQTNLSVRKGIEEDVWLKYEQERDAFEHTKTIVFLN